MRLREESRPASASRWSCRSAEPAAPRWDRWRGSSHRLSSSRLQANGRKSGCCHQARPGRLGGASVRIWAHITNPNPFGIRLSTLDGDLYLEGVRAANASFPLGLTLNARGDSVDAARSPDRLLRSVGARRRPPTRHRRRSHPLPARRHGQRRCRAARPTIPSVRRPGSPWRSGYARTHRPDRIGSGCGCPVTRARTGRESAFPCRPW